MANPVHFSEPISREDMLAQVLTQILDSLPQKRDWLDPDLERMAKDLTAPRTKRYIDEKLWIVEVALPGRVDANASDDDVAGMLRKSVYSVFGGWAEVKVKQGEKIFS